MGRLLGRPVKSVELLFRRCHAAAGFHDSEVGGSRTDGGCFESAGRALQRPQARTSVTYASPLAPQKPTATAASCRPDRDLTGGSRVVAFLSENILNENRARPHPSIRQHLHVSALRPKDTVLRDGYWNVRAGSSVDELSSINVGCDGIP